MKDSRDQKKKSQVSNRMFLPPHQLFVLVCSNQIQSGKSVNIFSFPRVGQYHCSSVTIKSFGKFLRNFLGEVCLR